MNIFFPQFLEYMSSPRVHMSFFFLNFFLFRVALSQAKHGFVALLFFFAFKKVSSKFEEKTLFTPLGH